MGFFQKYGHIMIDLETLSTRTNASVIEIGAVEFNKETGETGEVFSVIIDPSEWSRNGRHIDGGTIVWWLSQDEQARNRFVKPDKDKIMTLEEALNHFSSFVRRCDIQSHTDNHHETVTVWGNGATMDITILESAYEHFNRRAPWKYWAVNDVRTVVELNPSIKKEMKFDGVKHSAVDDCYHQIRYLTETLKSIKK